VDIDRATAEEEMKKMMTYFGDEVKKSFLSNKSKNVVTSRIRSVHIRVKWKWLTCSSFRSWYLVN
jgi:hypothetical protein